MSSRCMRVARIRHIMRMELYYNFTHGTRGPGGRRLPSNGEPAIHAKSAALGAANSAPFAAEPGEENQAIEKYRRWFEEMVEEEFSRAGLTDAIPGLLSGESNGAGLTF